ncbi:MATE family efflux transporter [Campylobacter sp. faydin G-24]|uniref:Multidrug-efflux transporter n=1 Tax=Campylobacter anatolicus TaxID=2829105 RepID=A0ABS5HG57_9BACT|nr:MATE family efflux transporter [Campylobacter anatolicus]
MNLLSDNLNKLIITLAVPAGMAMMFNTLYNVTATFFAARISTQAVAGLSMSFLLYISIVGMGLGFGSALTALVGNSLGARREFLAKIYAAKGVFFVLLFGVLMGVFGYDIAPNLLKFLGANDEFLGEALDYMSVIFLASPFFLLVKSLNGILVALGDTRTLRNWLFCGLFINTFLCFLYSEILSLGVAGIALANASVQLLGTIFMAYKVRKTHMIEFDVIYKFMPDTRIYIKILKQAVPACLNYLSMSLGGLVLLKFISYYGTEAVAGYGIALRIEQIVVLPTIGIAAAVLSIISRNYGARQYERVQICYKNALKILVYYCLFACGFCILFGYHIIKFFDDNIAVIYVAQSYLLINSFAYIGYGVLNVSGSALQAIKHPMAVLVFNALRQLVLQVGLYYCVVFILKKGIMFIWGAMFFNVYFIAICILFWTLSKLGKFNKA